LKYCSGLFSVFCTAGYKFSTVWSVFSPLLFTGNWNTVLSL
jgi:hypothetical protein